MCRFCHKHFGVKTDFHNQIKRKIKTNDSNGRNIMKKCPKCGKELKDEAKFCGGCGFKFSETSTSQVDGSVKCPSCGNLLKPGAKFCGKCGTKIDNIVKTDNADISKQASFIQWNILPGQLAVKIDSKEIASYGRVKGIVIQEDLKALFFVNGKITAQLEGVVMSLKSFQM